jgi:hypothetical protein
MHIHSCFRGQREKCEWGFILRDFVRKYNSKFGTCYDLQKCLDVSDSSRPQPEVILTAEGSGSLLIERKQIVLPSDYLKHHNRVHEFFDEGSYVYSEITKVLPPALYQLTLIQDELTSKDCKSVRARLKEVIDVIVAGRNTFQKHQFLEQRQPFFWRFCQLDDEDRKSGVVMEVFGSGGFSSPVVDGEAVNKFSGLFSKWIRETEKKFAGHEHSNGVLLLELVGDYFLFPTEEEIIEIINKYPLPECINQIWVTDAAWIDENDYEIDYECIRGSHFR